MSRCITASVMVTIGFFSYCVPSLGVPSGLGSLPRKLEIPTIEGRPLPVELLPAVDDAATIYVKPTEGIFINQGVVKSPLSRCDLVQGELEIADQNVKARNMVVASLRQAQADHQRNQDKYKTLIRKYEELNGLLEPMRNKVTEAEQEHKAAKDSLKQAQEELEENERQLGKATDPARRKELEEKSKRLRELVKRNDDAIDEAYVRLKKVRREFSDLETEHGLIKGRKTGIEKTLTTQLEELTKIQDQLDKMLEQSEKVLKKYSERVGGNTTFTVDFAPAGYLALLKKANPDLTFRYVPSVTATVDALIPGQVREGSALEARSGRLILDAKWSNAEAARVGKRFRTKIAIPEEAAKDPVKAIQSGLPDMEGSLTGAKALALELSILGYCALKEPESLSSQMNGGAKDTFKLALYYTYPVQYQIKLTGRYNNYASLYEFHKTTSSSSWFGLSRKQRQEHVRRMTNSTNMDIKVEPLGVVMTPQESLLLAEKVKEQLLFFAFQPYLEAGPAPKMEAKEDKEPLGASTVGKRLMLIPNPFAFWGGFVLSTLADMFGSKTSEAVQEISKETWVNLRYEAGFAFLHAADLTIGDLTKAKLVENK